MVGSSQAESVEDHCACMAPHLPRASTSDYRSEDESRVFFYHAAPLLFGTIEGVAPAVLPTTHSPCGP